jgi:hypothetical protein
MAHPDTSMNANSTLKTPILFHKFIAASKLYQALEIAQVS